MNDTKTAAASARVYTIHSLDEVEIDTRVQRVAALSANEARDLTIEIQRTSTRLWLLVTEAHDRKAHLALGYETWADYAKKELGMSESRSYQLLDTGHVMKAMAAAGVDLEMAPTPPARVVAKVKDRLTDVRKAAEAATKAGESVDKAIRALAREPKAPTKGRGRGQAAAAASAPTLDTVPAPRKSTEDSKATETCPACAGSGKVTKAVAERLLTLITKL